MIIIGADYHPGFRQIAFVDTDTGEFQEQRLQHREEAGRFYRDLAAQGMRVRVGMEASGHARWFEQLLSELQFELWMGDAAGKTIPESEMALFFECMQLCARKCLTRADIVREAILRQLRNLITSPEAKKNKTAQHAFKIRRSAMRLVGCEEAARGS